MVLSIIRSRSCFRRVAATPLYYGLNLVAASGQHIPQWPGKDGPLTAGINPAAGPPRKTGTHGIRNIICFLQIILFHNIFYNIFYIYINNPFYLFNYFKKNKKNHGDSFCGFGGSGLSRTPSP